MLNETKNNDKISKGFINVNGGKVWYKIVGTDKKGIPLLILHGGPGAPHDYLEPLELLSNDRPVIFYDQLGCGYSDFPNDTSLWTVCRFVDELETVRSALKLDKMHIFGQSWGSMLAVDYILNRNPNEVISLILSGPCLSSRHFADDQKKYLLELPESMQKVIIDCEASGKYDYPQYQDAMMYYYKLHVCRLDLWPDYLNRCFEKMGHSVYEYMWGPSEFIMTGTLKDYNYIERLHEINIPVLFTCGEFDEATPETTKLYQSKCPGSEIYIFEDASHEHFIEKPELFMQVIRDFFSKIEK